MVVVVVVVAVVVDAAVVGSTEGTEGPGCSSEGRYPEMHAPSGPSFGVFVLENCHFYLGAQLLLMLHPFVEVVIMIAFPIQP